MKQVNEYKVYVPVEVRFTEDGTMLPRYIVWEDGKKYKIDKVTDIRPAQAAKAGGMGERYTIMVSGNIVPIKNQSPKQRIDGTAALLDCYVGLYEHYTEYTTAI